MFIIKIPLIFFILTCSLLAQSFEFYKEKIEVRLNSNSCTVTGDYYFRNNNSKVTQSTIFYPFIVNDTIPFPENITIFSQGKEVIFFKKKNGLLFNIKLPARDSVKMVITYVQPAPYKKMEYILTSTSYWGKAFERAEYIIKLPKDFTLLNTSLDFNRCVDDNDCVVYSTVNYNYMPDKNFIITWK